MSETLAIVMAAGKGTRMESELPKVLVPACGRPMIEYVLDTLETAGVGRAAVVVGYRADDVRTALSGRSQLVFVEQTEQLGTGHAVMMCREQIAAHEGPVLVVTGDSPMIQVDSIRALLDLYESERPACILGSLHSDDPHGLGRIVRDAQGEFQGIVEEKDATPEQRLITEVNMSTYVFDAAELRPCLDQITNTNQQGEYYITDCPGILREAGKDVRALPVLKPCEALSVNNMEQLAVVEAEMRKLGMAQ
ncbi:UDP-N-acetylglucosamine pyrophosphorylase [Moorena producens 3L]|uniref:UDP-N-acetylglucosamine pyrophosphorylase n=1 Tax=Moorena producens 3L TaxID=489825 RepID=F4XRB4_9CYAN|nr:NTP transferase domain-containing protein [Moorena producens]EGJ32867.1 UDP-N-acetylglucosamine pyrophosphorylase [Moorena producens 3L]OLT55565.1 glycosyl transferase family 2 [Moorena producens 3L]